MSPWCAMPWSIEPQWSQKVGVRYVKVSHLCGALTAWEHKVTSPGVPGFSLHSSGCCGCWSRLKKCGWGRRGSYGIENRGCSRVHIPTRFSRSTFLFFLACFLFVFLFVFFLQPHYNPSSPFSLYNGTRLRNRENKSMKNKKKNPRRARVQVRIFLVCFDAIPPSA